MGFQALTQFPTNEENCREDHLGMKGAGLLLPEGRVTMQCIGLEHVMWYLKWAWKRLSQSKRGNSSFIFKVACFRGSLDDLREYFLVSPTFVILLAQANDLTVW